MNKKTLQDYRSIWVNRTDNDINHEINALTQQHIKNNYTFKSREDLSESEKIQTLSDILKTKKR